MGRFLTPPTLPADKYCRQLLIPNSPEWIGTITGALLPMIYPTSWEKITGIEPQDAADAVFAMLVEMWAGDGDCENTMDCDATIQCMLDSGLLGSNIPNGDIRVDGGVPQVSYDGGVTWQDIPGDAGADPFTPSPVTTPGADADIRKCLAATRAALVLNETYKGVYGAVTADIYNSANAFANWLLNVNQQLLLLVYGEAAAVLNAEILRDYSLPTNYTAGELTTEQVEELTCFLLDYATDNPGGLVTFNWGAIRDNMITVMGVNPGTALWSIVVYLKNRGLERASQVAITNTGNCGSCGDAWCYTFDFSTGQHGWVIQEGRGFYQNSRYESRYIAPSSYLDIRRLLTEQFTLTSVRVEGVAGATANTGSRFVLRLGPGGTPATQIGTLPSGGGAFNTLVEGEWDVYGVYVQHHSSNINQMSYISRVTLTGIGTNPFEESNC